MHEESTTVTLLAAWDICVACHSTMASKGMKSEAEYQDCKSLQICSLTNILIKILKIIIFISCQLRCDFYLFTVVSYALSLSHLLIICSPYAHNMYLNDVWHVFIWHCEHAMFCVEILMYNISFTHSCVYLYK